MRPTMTPQNDFESIGAILPGALKEISRRAELRPRLEAEWGRSLTDEEFLAVAEEAGGQL